MYTKQISKGSRSKKPYGSPSNLNESKGSDKSDELRQSLERYTKKLVQGTAVNRSNNFSVVSSDFEFAPNARSEVKKSPFIKSIQFDKQIDDDTFPKKAPNNHQQIMAL